MNSIPDISQLSNVTSQLLADVFLLHSGVRSEAGKQREKAGWGAKASFGKNCAFSSWEDKKLWDSQLCFEIFSFPQ